MRARPQTSWICSLTAIACIACGACIGCDGVETGAESAESGKSGEAGGRGRAEALRVIPAVKPNIVIIVTDDQATSTLAHMPHTQELLVREGTLFPNFFINDPICCPSRVTILLGQYRHNHQIERSQWGCGFRFFKEGMHRRSFGTMVREAGYRTGYVGKYLNSHRSYVTLKGPDPGGDHLLAGWDDYHILLDSSYLGFELHENGKLRELPADSGHYQTDVLAELATTFIGDSADAEKPFFLFIAPGAPHGPGQPARRHRAAFEGVRAPRIPSFNEVDVSGQPGLEKSKRMGAFAATQIDRRYRAQLQMLAAVDELVRDVVAALQASGHLEDTYLLFASDNGMHFGEHRIQRGKATPFEEAVRVPLVIRGPGVVRDRVAPQLTANVDILPTVLDLIGETPGPAIDGRSLVPLFGPDAEAAVWRNAIVLESRHEKRNQGIPSFGAIRTNRFKWIEYERGGRALYDLRDDPHEMTNIHGPASQDTTQALSAWLFELLHCSGSDCLRVENETLDTPRG
jgi:arylsulfatase A-like enzyme